MIEYIQIFKGKGYHTSSVDFFYNEHWHTRDVDTEARAKRVAALANSLISRGAIVEVGMHHITIRWER